MSFFTSVTGFPRIGELRELKFCEEKYFRGEISEEELKQTAKQLRKKHWLEQNGIDFIPSNDFSYYDNMLDTAVLFNIIPERYKNLCLSETDTYFAMARGYQKNGKDVKALAMKKWFNTNYHYIVPEYEDDIQIKLTRTKPFDEYIEAKEYGIDTVPSLIGPLTLIKLIRFKGNIKENDILNDILTAYKQLTEKFEELGAKWIAFCEPFLVKDLTKEDIELFEKIYLYLLESKRIKVLLQTYFGDVRNCVNSINKLDFDGVGLDFCEGKKTEEIVCDIDKNKLLFAGVVNGKNIWKNNYTKTIDIIRNTGRENIVISTSCSLLHVPYTLENESKLELKSKKYFAFAKEKLAELKEIKDALNSTNETDAFRENKVLFSSERYTEDKEVKNKVQNINNEQYTRLPAFNEREKIQKERFKFPLLPTTTIGSFPQTIDVKQNRAKFKKGEISESEYIEFNKKKIKECIELQEELGIDVLVHGEYERNDMVEYFGENLNGFIFTEKAWVQSYGTRCVKPPIIWGDISRKAPITVEWSKYAQSLTKKPVKGMLTGPVTILNWSFPREDISTKESTLQIALAIRDEVLDLEKNDIKIIQIDEAALREKLPLRKSDWHREYLDWVIPSFRLVHSCVKADTQIHTHMCYSEFSDIIKAIDAMDADVITFEASRSDLQLLDVLKENNFKTEVGPGVYDIHSPRVPSVEEIVSAIEKMLTKTESSKLWINPDCGLKTRGNEETIKSLKNMVEAVNIVRKKLNTVSSR